LDDFRRVEADNMKSGEHKRLASIAITELQTAQMWAVKAVTWKDY
jgi:cell division protein FtsL